MMSANFWSGEDECLETQMSEQQEKKKVVSLA